MPEGIGYKTFRQRAQARGGLSGGSSQNRNVNAVGKVIYDTGAPKPTHDGRDLSKNATNVIVKGVLKSPLSPSADAASRNKSFSTGSGRS